MKLVKFLLILFIPLTLFVPIYGEEDTYKVVDNNSGFVEEYDNYDDALSFFNKNTDDYDNLLLYENDKLINMEYGIVEIMGDEPIEYHSTLRNIRDYLNGEYGIDGAYLYTSDNGKQVYFALAGDMGYTNIDNVILHPIETLEVNPSLYNVSDGYLYHNIKTQLDYEYCGLSLCLDIAPDYLDDGNYYSYDGHYFYDDFYAMIIDYKNDNYDNAVNEEPYYNYYQFLPYRTLTNYTVEELEDYFYNTLGMNGRLNNYYDYDADGAVDEINRSQFYQNVNEFFNNQYLYGCNAMMLISSAIVESSYGKSLNSYLNNKLYINAAYESNHEKEDDRYDSVAGCIYSQAKYYISKLYSNYLKDTYAGTYYGNRLGGINIEYCLDHYYGEKAASAYFKLDSALGLKDRGSIAVGVIKNKDALSFYYDDEFEYKVFSLNDISELVLPIIDEEDDCYLVQVDPSFNSDYLYDYSNSIAYVSKDAFEYIENYDSIHGYELNTINYDFNGGEYQDYSGLSIKVLNNGSIPKIVPKAYANEFSGYSSYVADDGTLVYSANYRGINNIELENFFNKQSDFMPYPNYSKSRLKINYEDGTSVRVPINSDMVTPYSISDTDEQTVCAEYAGLEIEKDFAIDNVYYENYAALKSAIENGEFEYVKDNIDSVYYPLSMSQIRTIDDVLKDDHNRNYVINDKTNSFDISISGLDLSIDDRRNFNLIEDTYYVTVNSINVRNRTKIEDVAKGYGFETVTGLNLSFNFNYQNVDLRGQAIVQINIDNKDNNRIYSVYHLDSVGNVIKCRTTQTDNYIQFVINEKGDYLVLSMPSVNTYSFDDDIENLSYENMGIDNNRINIEFMFGLSLIIIALIGIIIYYNILDKKDKEWKDYRKSLLKADTVLEEKQKN